ncbi:MAG TPA: asparagine synthase (glutamine-hydrolyzing) [Gammaproteobacteria bacterium]|nr:asparagine synthase (glutamine-hydrolyzing) [Gammaproteobacteria bacterium]
MCGIAGVIRRGPVRADEIRRMTNAIAHRGPDGEGVLTAGNAGFGHRRLAIIDPDGSPQPMQSASGRHWLTFNGEIYNYADLKPALEARAPLVTHGDTEVLLRLLMRDGEAALPQLRGMFAFAFYDFERRRLLAARDHFGQKPLYYWHDGETFAFASEIKALLALEPGLAEMDEDALHEYLSLRVITPPRSMFRRIRKLPPAHFLVFENGRVEVQPYWQLRFEPKRRIGFNEAVDELELQAREAVSYTLVSDVPVGAFLSGGMDSSLITGLMHGATGQAFETFTGDVPYPGHSDYEYGKAVADRYGLPNRRLPVNPSLIRSLPRVIWHLDEPADALSVCTFHLAELARRHVKVVLGGDGGDELFGGYDRYYGNTYARYYALLPRVLRERALAPLIARLSGGSWYRSAGHRLKWLHFLASHEGGRRYAKSLGYFYFTDEYRDRLYTQRFRSSVSAFDPEQGIELLYDSADADDALDRMLYADDCTRLPDHPLMILDRMTMAHGLEARSPFLDHVLAERCAVLPSAFKIRGTELRRIEKALAKRYVPQQVLERSKQGFSSPLPYLLRDEFRRLYDTLLRGSALVEDGYLTGAGVNGLVEDHLAGRMDHGQRLWLLCSAEIWYRIHLRGQQADEVETALLRAAA